MTDAGAPGGGLFAAELERLLGAADLNKHQLSKLAGLSAGYIGMLVSGTRLPTTEALEKLIPYLGADLEGLQALVEADRLGARGMTNLRRHLFTDFDRYRHASQAIATACAAFAAGLGGPEPLAAAAFQALLGGLREAVAGTGVALWRYVPALDAMQMLVQDGLPAEYQAIGNLKFREQGMRRGELFPVLDAYLLDQPVRVERLGAQPTHGLHFYARSAGYDGLYAFPIRASHAVLAIYQPTQPEMAPEEFQGWVELASALLRLALAHPACLADGG